jgi:hypothetical protein
MEGMEDGGEVGLSWRGGDGEKAFEAFERREFSNSWLTERLFV